MPGELLGGIKKVFSCKAMGMNVKRRLYEVAVLIAPYGDETWECGSNREGIKCN